MAKASRPTCRAARSPRDERRQARESFAVGSDCVIVATSTLERALEVGDHDRVFQIDAPVPSRRSCSAWGVAGPRRVERHMLFLATRPEYLFRALALDLGSRGDVEPVVPLVVDPAGGEHDLEGLGDRDKEKEIRNNAGPGAPAQVHEIRFDQVASASRQVSYAAMAFHAACRGVCWRDLPHVGRGECHYESRSADVLLRCADPLSQPGDVLGDVIAGFRPGVRPERARPPGHLPPGGELSAHLRASERRPGGGHQWHHPVPAGPRRQRPAAGG